MGPNGHRMASRLKDLAVLPKDLKDSIIILGGDLLRLYMETQESKPKMIEVGNSAQAITRKLQVIKDKEMKNRPIAIFDW